jgi:hypothetical protein
MRTALLLTVVSFAACTHSGQANDAGTGGAGGGGTGGAGGALDSGSPDGARDGRGVDGVPADTRAGDATADARPADVGSPPPAVGCPGPDAYVGNPAWKNVIIATATATSCVPQAFGRTLKQAQQDKAMVRIAAGRYPFLDAPGPAPFALPACLLLAGGKTVAAGAGTVRFSTRLNGAYEFAQPIAGEPLWIGGAAFGPQPFMVMLNGDRDSSAGAGIDLFLCRSADCAPGTNTFLDSCTFEGVTPVVHKVTLEGGAVDLELRIDRRGVSVGNEPAAFVRATGMFQGVAFDQRDYFKLIYRPAVNHHFVRDFAVLFDAPIAGACGLEVSGIQRMTGPTAFAVDCALEHLRPIPILSVN